MDYVNLGDTGLKVSQICLGMMSYGTPDWRDWVLDEDESREFIERALDLGINFFDTADMYSLGVSEEVTGRALRDMAEREEYVVASKAYFSTGDGPNEQGLSRKHLMDAVDASLQRLGTGYIDLYYIHRWDYDTPLEETLKALHDIVESGKVRYIGASSMFAFQFTKALYKAEIEGWTRFVAMQNHYNLVYREEEREMIPLCAEEGIGVCPWSPLARGFLAGNRGKVPSEGETPRAQQDEFAHDMYYNDSDFEVLDRVEELAETKGYSPAQISLAWLINKSEVTAPVIGATKMYQLEEAAAAPEIELTDQEMARLEEPYVPHPMLGHAPYGENQYDR